MKKLIFLIAALSVLALSGCSSNQNDSSSSATASSSQSHTVELKELGLTYTTPAAWAEFETTNLYPLTIQSEGTLARIIYNYVKEEDISSMESATDSSSYQSYLTPICEIMVAPTENFSNDTLKALTSLYENAENVSEQNGYSYYVLYPCTANTLEGKDLENYNKMAEAVPELIESISTEDFNPEDIKPIIDTDELKKYITFDTHTLEGEAINSTVFGDYDLTMVNFWGTYTYPDINETAVLAELDKQIKTMEGVNFMQVVIDTPSEEAEELALKIKAENGAEYTSVIPDKRLASWIVNNIEGIPTTVFVNNDAVVVGEPIQGVKTLDEYLTLLNAQLETMKSQDAANTETPSETQAETPAQ